MSKSHKIVSEFNLAGQFFGFILKDGYQPKMLRLNTNSGEYWIKVPKELRGDLVRAELYNQLKPGDRIQVNGQSIRSMKNGTIKLVADRVQLPTNHFSPISPTSPISPSSQPSATPTMPCSSTANATGSQQKKCSILVCDKSDCRKRGGEEIAIALEEQLQELGLGDRVQIKKTGCMSRCKQAPNVVVMPDKTRYSGLDVAEIPELIEKHFPVTAMT
jgi:(2Fe-2S) ferredoxin